MKKPRRLIEAEKHSDGFAGDGSRRHVLPRGLVGTVPFRDRRIASPLPAFVDLSSADLSRLFLLSSRFTDLQKRWHPGAARRPYGIRTLPCRGAAPVVYQGIFLALRRSGQSMDFLPIRLSAFLNSFSAPGRLCPAEGGIPSLSTSPRESTVVESFNDRRIAMIPEISADIGRDACQELELVAPRDIFWSDGTSKIARQGPPGLFRGSAPD